MIKLDSQSDKLIKLASSYKLFHDDSGEAYAWVNNEVIPIRSRQFKQLLAKMLWDIESKVPNTDTLSQALNVIEAKAIFEGECTKLYNRIAKHGGALYYDLTAGKAVKITENGWEVANNFPILFKRYAHQQKQVEPKKGGDIKKLQKFFKIQDKQIILLLSYLIVCFIPNFPSPILIIIGPQGSGKTTICKLLKKLVDPSKTEEVSILPKDQNELIQKLVHHRICFFDNVAKLSDWVIGIFSQVCTGTGFSKRKLYSDEDDILWQLQHSIGLNGLTIPTSRADFLDRVIIFHLERLKPTERQEVERLLNEFEREKSFLLGAIFNTLSETLKFYPSIKLTSLPRMADFAHWGAAASLALGYSPEDFIEVYNQNIQSRTEEIVLSNTLIQSVLNFMAGKSEWRGYINEAYEQLKRVACKIYPVTSSSIPPTRLDETFPRHPNKLRNALEEHRVILSEYRIEFTIGKHTNAGTPIIFKNLSKPIIEINEEIEVEIP
jgi:energy-coupling factor transporter ATP-binding protein EcfA2